MSIIESQLSLLHQLKTQPLAGRFVDFVPADKEFSPHIVTLRNSARGLYSFNQHELLTVEGQNAWLDGYFSRENDIYWAVFNKAHVFVGVTRIYDIDLEQGTAESGSTIFDETLSKEAPYALEACFLPIALLLDELGIREVLTHTRTDNLKVLSFNKRLGVIERKIVDINGVPYIEAYFTAESLNRQMVDRLLDRWAQRDQRATQKQQQPLE